MFCPSDADPVRSDGKPCGSFPFLTSLGASFPRTYGRYKQQASSFNIVDPTMKFPYTPQALVAAEAL